MPGWRNNPQPRRTPPLWAILRPVPRKCPRRMTGVEEAWEEEAQETEEAFGDSEVLGSDSLDDVEEGEDSELEETLEDSLVDEEAWGESTGQEDAQDEEEQEDSPYSMSM